MLENVNLPAILLPLCINLSNVSMQIRHTEGSWLFGKSSKKTVEKVEKKKWRRNIEKII